MRHHRPAPTGAVAVLRELQAETEEIADRDPKRWLTYSHMALILRDRAQVEADIAAALGETEARP